MPRLTVLDLDRMIHTAMKPPYHTGLRFQMVAMVMAGVLVECRARGFKLFEDMILERILVLAAAGVIDSSGDLEDPSAGEICLKSEAPLTLPRRELTAPSPDVFELDRMILSAMKPSYRKVAMVIVCVLRECETRGLDITEEAVGERIIALDAAGMINSMGNLEFPRWSEICLKPEEGA